MAVRSPQRDALRLLYILVAGCSRLPNGEPSGAKAIFRGETRLQAFDFWMRYPDYLAEELLDLYEETGVERYLLETERIFSDNEPDIRRFPMLRYRFGAFEPLDDALAILCSRRLVVITGRKSGDNIMETDFLLMPEALALADRVANEFPPLAWYARRAKLVAIVAGDLGGKALKARQYSRVEYAETRSGGTIPPIAERVRARLEVMRRPRMDVAHAL